MNQWYFGYDLTWFVTRRLSKKSAVVQAQFSFNQTSDTIDTLIWSMLSKIKVTLAGVRAWALKYDIPLDQFNLQLSWKIILFTLNAES